MKTNKIYTRVLAIALLPLLLGGCLNDLFEQRDRTYQGPSQLEFYPTTRTVNESNDSAVETGTLIQLIGPQQSAAVPVSYSVDGSSTALEGTHYNLVTASPATLGANSSSTQVSVEVIANSMPDGDGRPLFYMGANGREEGKMGCLRCDLVIQNVVYHNSVWIRPITTNYIVTIRCGDLAQTLAMPLGSLCTSDGSRGVPVGKGSSQNVEGIRISYLPL